MYSNNWQKQVEEAQNNCNYFFNKLLSCILSIILKLLSIILISIIFNYLIINIIAILYTFYSLYSLMEVTSYYMNIIKDIAISSNIKLTSFEVDPNIYKEEVLKKILNFSK